MYKFENLEVWHLALEYTDMVYKITEKLPKSEDYNLKSQTVRAATSIALNIAEGSTGQTNAEFARFITMAVRSCIEVIACLILIKQRGYIDKKMYSEVYEFGGRVFAKLQALKKSLLRTADHRQRTTDHRQRT